MSYCDRKFSRKLFLSSWKFWYPERPFNIYYVNNYTSEHEYTIRKVLSSLHFRPHVIKRCWSWIFDDFKMNDKSQKGSLIFLISERSKRLGTCTGYNSISFIIFNVKWMDCNHLEEIHNIYEFVSNFNWMEAHNTTMYMKCYFVSFTLPVPIPNRD